MWWDEFGLLAERKANIYLRLSKEITVLRANYLDDIDTFYGERKDRDSQVFDDDGYCWDLADQTDQANV